MLQLYHQAVQLSQHSANTIITRLKSAHFSTVPGDLKSQIINYLQVKILLPTPQYW